MSKAFSITLANGKTGEFDTGFELSSFYDMYSNRSTPKKRKRKKTKKASTTLTEQVSKGDIIFSEGGTENIA